MCLEFCLHCFTTSAPLLVCVMLLPDLVFLLVLYCFECFHHYLLARFCFLRNIAIRIWFTYPHRNMGAQLVLLAGKSERRI